MRNDRSFSTLLTLLFLLPATQAGATVTQILSSNISSTTYEATSTNNLILHLTVADSGSGDTLQNLTVINADTHSFPYKAQEPADLLNLKLWWDADGNTTAGMSLLGSLTRDAVITTQWDFPTSSAITAGHLFVTADIQGPASLTGTRYLKMQVPTNGAVFQTGGSFPAGAVGNISTLYLTPQTPPELFVVSLDTTLPPVVNSGVSLLDLGLFHFNSDPSTGHENDAGTFIRGFWVTILDNGLSVPPSSLFTSISATSQDPDPLNNFPYLDATQGDAAYLANPTNLSGNSLYIDLTQNISEGFSFVPGTPVSMLLQGTLLPGASINSLQLAVSQSSQFSAYDNYSGRPVTATAAVPAPTPYFLLTNPSVFQQGATQVGVTFTSTNASGSVPKGSSSNTAFQMVLLNQGTAVGQAQVTSVYFDLEDEGSNPVVPRTALSNIRIDDGVNIYLQRPVTESTGSRVICALSPPINLTAGNPVTVNVRYGVRADALPQGILFRVPDTGPGSSPDWSIVQPGTSTLIPVAGNAPFQSPASSAATITVNLGAFHQATSPTMVFRGQTAVPFMELQLTHPGPAAVGGVVLQSLAFRLTDQEGVSVNAADVFSALRADSAVTYAQSVAWSADQAIITFTSGITLLSSPPGNSVTLAILGDLLETYSGSGIRLSLETQDDLTLTQPGDPLRAVEVTPSSGDAFPMASGRIPVGGATLQDSFTNFPNPFQPNLGPTSLAFRLDSTATVTLKIFTLTGAPVKTVLKDVTRPAGLNVERWDGRNESGRIVLNGLYLSVLETDSGGNRQTVKRFLAVLK